MWIGSLMPTSNGLRANRDPQLRKARLSSTNRLLQVDEKGEEPHAREGVRVGVLVMVGLVELSRLVLEHLRAKVRGVSSAVRYVLCCVSYARYAKRPWCDLEWSGLEELGIISGDSSHIDHALVDSCDERMIQTGRRLAPRLCEAVCPEK